MTQVALPVGFFSLPDPRASGRGIVNAMAEVNPYGSQQLTAFADGKSRLPPAYLRRAPGTTAFANDGTTNAVRGVWEMGGVVYAVIGPTLYSVTATGSLVYIATGIAGPGFVRMTDNKSCLVILLPGTKIAYTYCPMGGGFAQLTNPGFTQYGAIDCWFCDSYIVFLALNGLEFFNDDGQEVSGQGQITFTTAAVFPRELGTDPFVGMAVYRRLVAMFGRRTSEGYLNVGNQTGSPFGSASGTFLQIGMHPDAAYTAVVQSQPNTETVLWLANDRTVRQLNGAVPVRVSNHGVESLLSDADLTGCYAFGYALGGHQLYVLTMPAEQLTLVWDATTGEWHQMSSLIDGSWSYWRPLCCINAFGDQLVGDSQSGQIGQLDFGTFTEYGQPMTARFRTQSVYDGHNRIVHRRFELVATPGGATSYTNTPMATLKVSDDSGRTFRALPGRSLGVRGAYDNRAVWWNLGMSRDRVYEVELSDPTEFFTVDMQAELVGGKW